MAILKWFSIVWITVVVVNNYNIIMILIVIDDYFEEFEIRSCILG